MKIAIIGIGQCGCNIADQFAVINGYASNFFGRHVEIVSDILAVNTDETDLRGFSHIANNRRVLVGAAKVHGHGVGKKNTVAAKIFKDDHFMLAEELFRTRSFFEIDAAVVIASAAGGTGSGGIGQVVKTIKERLQQPVFSIIVLPFGYEENGVVSYAVTNAASCLRTIDEYADATFLLDNERFGRGASIDVKSSFREMNSRMANNFYDLFCAGEEKVRKYIGSKVTDAGDILASLSGFSVVGRGEYHLPTWKRLRKGFDEQMRKTQAVSMTLLEARNNLSMDIDLKEARKILALLCAPQEFITQPALQEIYYNLLDKSPKAEIRIGDYPRGGRKVSLTLVASELVRIPRIEELYVRALTTMKAQTEAKKETEDLIKKRRDKGKGIPRLA